jgi:hypothetical protein
LQVATGNTSETCVFCHTPHGSDTNAAVPLWNKELPDPTSYTRYSTLGTSTLDGEEAPVGSVSLACLSCHDGSQAVDTVLNVPGSGLAGDGTNVPSPPAAGWQETEQTFPVRRESMLHPLGSTSVLPRFQTLRRTCETIIQLVSSMRAADCLARIRMIN